MKCNEKNNRLSLWISPCPNDTFVFHALLNGLVDTEGLSFDLHFADIETLNERAIAGCGDIIKASVAVAPMVDYVMLDSGAALGYGNGPIVVGRCGEAGKSDLTVAVPGLHTTAALLFARYFPAVSNVVAMPFRSIAPAVASGRVDYGVLIHEGRFTFADQGLCRVADLGALWEDQMHMPIPLGAIYANRTLGTEVIKSVERTIARSTLYAQRNRAASADFVRANAAELSPVVLRCHIDYFVTDFTISLGAVGREAIATLLAKAAPAK
ncbi:MAG: 1,4-dihydroxy-6-naphthoate synthase [Mucinivorans sp.]